MTYDPDLKSRIAALESDRAKIVQQDGADPGDTIFVQLSGDSAPSAGTRGNILFEEEP